MPNRMITALVAVMAFVGIGHAQTGPEVLQQPQAAPIPESGVRIISSEPVCPEIGGFGWSDRIWVRSDFLVGWFKGMTLPPLVTTSPTGTARARAGVLGQPGTGVLFDGIAGANPRIGFRMEMGASLDDSRRIGVEAGFTVIESQARIYNANSDSSLILARPFLNSTNNVQQSVLVAFPGSSAGGVDIRANSGSFYEAHLDFNEVTLQGSCARLMAILGYRFYRYDEGLRMQQGVLPTDPNFAPGTRITSIDNFISKNEFHGCDLGFRTETQLEDWTMSLLTKVAVGSLHSSVDISGAQVTSAPGATTSVQQGGVYALRSNIGSYRINDWTAMPEIGLHIGWRAMNNVRLTLGYNVIYLMGVARASDQVSLRIDPALFPPAGASDTNQPSFRLNRHDMWIQSLSFGAEVSF